MGKTGTTRAGTSGDITTASLKTGTHANDGFGVFAYYTGANDYTYASVKTDGTSGNSTVKPNFMYNQQVKWTSGKTGYVGADGDQAWAYTPLKYWPNDIQNGAVDDQTPAAATGDGTKGGKLTFFAYAPYIPVTESSGTPTGSMTDGITAMTANTASSDPILSYTVASTPANFVDLLWGTAGTNGVNVLGTAQNGVSYNASGTNYQKSILPNYTLNADLTKQKTEGQVSFAFKHALSKVGGKTVGTGDANGLMIMLDLDSEKGEETGGTKADATKVTVKSISISAKAKTAASDDDKYLQTNMSGDFNLANGRWNITSTTGTSTSAATVSHTINQDGTSAQGVLADAIKEPTTWNATWASNPAGVTTTAQNVYNTESSPLVFIPGTYPELTITVDYFVRTEDTKLDGGYSQVEQVITKTLTFANAVELNKQYNIIIHLGLTSVKFTATVDDWDADIDGDGTIEPTGDDKQDVYVPINVK